MGQIRPVRVINFVAKGTIEEGMLSVLAFKRSLSAGILDGGSGEISLGGSRLNRFMKDVENVTSRMGEGEAVTPSEEIGCGATRDSAATSQEDVDGKADDGEPTMARLEPPVVPQAEAGVERDQRRAGCGLRAKTAPQLEPSTMLPDRRAGRGR